MPGHYYEPLEEQLRFLREAGFSSVDCFWKRLGQTIVGGYKWATRASGSFPYTPATRPPG